MNAIVLILFCILAPLSVAVVNTIIFFIMYFFVNKVVFFRNVKTITKKIITSKISLVLYSVAFLTFILCSVVPHMMQENDNYLVSSYN